MRCNFEQHATAELVISPCFASQVLLPPSHSKACLARLRRPLAAHNTPQVFSPLYCYGASSGTNYLEHYSTPLPTQCLCVQSKVRLAYNHTAMHWSTPCHCKRHKLGACKGRVKNNLKTLVYSHLLMALSK